MRDGLLACSIRRLLSNIGAQTPLHVFVFAMDGMAVHLKSQLTTYMDAEMFKARVCIVSISREQWNYSPRRREYGNTLNRNYRSQQAYLSEFYLAYQSALKHMH
jgi:hypothetical protein